MFTRFHRDDAGATAVEFALVAVLLITIILGIVEFGLLMAHQNAVTSAAREGARDLAIHDDTAQAASVTQTAFDLGTLTVATVACDGENVSVTAAYDYPYLMIGFIPGIPASTTLESTGVMRCGG